MVQRGNVFVKVPPCDKQARAFIVIVLSMWGKWIHRIIINASYFLYRISFEKHFCVIEAYIQWWIIYVFF